MLKILVVEDDKDLNCLVCRALELGGYKVTEAQDGKIALEILEKEKFDMIITDIMMPNVDGFEFAKTVRINDKTTPIIFMSAKTDKPSKMYGYQIGIDDYIVKPFDVDELTMKVSALFRRINVQQNKEIVIGNLVINKEERTVKIDDEQVPLTVREFDLLYKFCLNPKKTFTRSALMDEFWGYDSSATSRTVDVYMSKLRDKTANCTNFEIVTVHGLGYKSVIK